MQLFALVFLLLWMLVVPLVLGNVRHLPWGPRQRWLLCEAVLFVSIVIMFLACWMGGVVARDLLAPQLFDIEYDSILLDAPLTTRTLCFISTMVIMPMLILQNIGLVSLRDIHQICKEARDQMFKKPKPLRK